MTTKVDMDQLRAEFDTAPTLLGALERLIGDCERGIHVEFGGSPWLEGKLKELDYARAAVAKAKATDAEAAAQELRKDAERYRWLRNGGNDDIGVVTGFDCVDIGSTGVAGTYREGLEGEHLDKAIDAAMEEQE